MVVVKEELTKKQEIILKQLTEEKLNIKQIAQERGVSRQAVYAQHRILVRKGWLRKEYSANYERVD